MMIALIDSEYDMRTSHEYGEVYSYWLLGDHANRRSFGENDFGSLGAEKEFVSPFCAFHYDYCDLRKVYAAESFRRF